MPPDLAIVDIDKPVLLRGKRYRKTYFQGQDNNPYKRSWANLATLVIMGNKDISSVEKVLIRGQYIQTVTYKRC